MDTMHSVTVFSCMMLPLSILGLLGSYKQYKILLLYHLLLSILLAVCLLVSAAFTAAFRQQVGSNAKAEMLHDVRNYKPYQTEIPVSKAWDDIQNRLECCGFMNEQVSNSWEQWKYNTELNRLSYSDERPLSVPGSCCNPGSVCSSSTENNGTKTVSTRVTTFNVTTDTLKMLSKGDCLKRVY